MITPDKLAKQASDIVEQIQDLDALVAYQLLDALNKQVEDAMRDLESIEIGG